MSYFEENNKFLSFKGVIGRRDFIILYLILMLISSIIYQTPMMYALIIKPELMHTLSTSTPPMWLSVLMLIAGIITGILFFPAVVRRIRDILGEENDNKIYLIATTCFAIGIISITPVGKQLGIFIIDIVIDLILIFTRGKITGEKPKSDIIKFNWGAFWGTCFWGLWNKVYKTLWIIPLLFTSGWFIFMLICGLKGNEWSYEKNKEKYNSTDDFHSKQSTQSIVFTILTPIFALACFIILSAFTGITVSHYAKNHPDFIIGINTKLLKYQQKATRANFEKIEMTQNIYKFYIDPQSWQVLSVGGKNLFFENALNYALIENNKYSNPESKIEDYIKIAKKVKIISSFNNEILLEFSPTDEDETKLIEYSKIKDFKNFMALKKSCTKINPNPTLP